MPHKLLRIVFNRISTREFLSNDSEIEPFLEHFIMGDEK